jgi:hypothetical protein
MGEEKLVEGWGINPVEDRIGFTSKQRQREGMGQE